MYEKIVIIGGEGNGSVIADAITDGYNRCCHTAQIFGFLNDRIAKGDSIGNYPVLGALADLPEFLAAGCHFIYTIYRIDGQEERIRLFRSLNIPHDRLFTFIHPLAYIAPSVKIGPGSVIMPQVSVSADAVIGECCLLMVNSTVGHNTIISDYCHLAAQSCLSSHVMLEEGVHIGLNATVRENLVLKKYSTLGMGSVLLHDLDEKEIRVGNPAKYLRQAL
ncbi:MAG: hypothetical protein K9N06_10570 [Candidatus Cloacimonetes bacterium]|nr:hypothetical protein [Candidatus Cloacimonadota bacterium]